MLDLITAQIYYNRMMNGETQAELIRDTGLSISTIHRIYHRKGRYKCLMIATPAPIIATNDALSIGDLINGLLEKGAAITIEISV